MTTASTRENVRGGIGTSPQRPDGVLKVRGGFAYASDLQVEGMLWGATLRSPHAHARIVCLDTSPALAMAGVHAVLTQDDVPGKPFFGQAVQDQPVLASGETQFWGEPVAIVAADDLGIAQRAVEAIVAEYEVLEPLVDSELADRLGSVTCRPRMRRGDPDAAGEVIVEGYYEVGQQDQAPLGNEAGLAIPDDAGGVDLHATSQWIHEDHAQIFPSLGLAPEQVRCHPVGMGGAFGAREDMSMHIHLCLLALRTGRPVKMVFDRAEGFVGHVHRHPAKMWFRHEANRDGKLVKVAAKIILDGGPYHATSNAVTFNAAYFAVGPYVCDNVVINAVAVRTNNPPAGAMRGFGCVQSAFAHEAQMDRLAAELEIDPLDLRRINALEAGRPNSTTGQIIEGSLPTTRVIDELASMPLPEPLASDDPRQLPGGTGLTTDAAHITRGIGYGVTLKNLAFSEGFDDYADVAIVLTDVGVEVHTAAIEVGQGLVTVIQQIVRSILGIEEVNVVWANTSRIGSSGSTSASRQTQMTGGAAFHAAIELRKKILDGFDADDLSGEGAWREGNLVATLREVHESGPWKHELRFRHPETFPPDENGQGDMHAGFVVAAHRAVVDVDQDLGLVRVVQMDTVQDVGRVLNPIAAVGQIEGGTMQGVGLALLEELVLDKGEILNPNFTDYLLPTFLDAPHIEVRFVEEASHWGPFGAKGIGEPPTISATPAVVAAIRDATGRSLTRVPVRPEDIALG